MRDSGTFRTFASSQVLFGLKKVRVGMRQGGIVLAAEVNSASAHLGGLRR